MSRKDDGLLDVLSEAPWWVSILVAVIVFVGARWILPPILAHDRMWYTLANPSRDLSWFAAIFLLPAAFSALNARRKRRQLDQQKGLDSIRELSWKRFEELLGEAYRRQGYSVSENSHAGADGGVDLVIRRGSETVLVQCKQWRVQKVGVKVIREMLGLVTAHGASRAVVVTSGDFTAEAIAFASSQPIELVNGTALLDLVHSVQSGSAAVAAPVASPSAPSRVCPRCGGQLVMRTARRGENAGSSFWGCSSYPRCRHTEPAD
jgi:restriction system protein